MKRHIGADGGSRRMAKKKRRQKPKPPPPVTKLDLLDKIFFGLVVFVGLEILVVVWWLLWGWE